MEDQEPRYFQLPIDSLRALGSWCAGCAALSLPVFEYYFASDPRPRAAIEGIRVFAAGEKRTALLRTLALGAFSAAREAGNPPAAAAARAAGLAASSAYTHPMVDVQQTKHILGPAAYAALALELDQAANSQAGKDVILWAIEHVTIEVRDVLVQMPGRQPGKSRLDRLMFELDSGIRNRKFPLDA